MNSSGPFVSVIMTAFNEEKYINEAIESNLLVNLAHWLGMKLFKCIFGSYIIIPCFHV